MAKFHGIPFYFILSDLVKFWDDIKNYGRGHKVWFVEIINPERGLEGVFREVDVFISLSYPKSILKTVSKSTKKFLKISFRLIEL
jgi:hypothetical protein